MTVEGVILQPVRILTKILSQLVDIPKKISLNLRLYMEHKNLSPDSRLILALTPPDDMRSLGDHAQALAIRKWLSKHNPTKQIWELDKNQCQHGFRLLRRLIHARETLFLQSGGNLGDRGIWSESIRRSLIQNFPKNRIVSLPQTIYFSPTKTGQLEKEKTATIYGVHPNLTILSRDPNSFEQAQKLFPNARNLCSPDFAITLKGQTRSVTRKNIGLICLRQDNESRLTHKERVQITQLLSIPYKLIDINPNGPITKENRGTLIQSLLDEMGQSQFVITDRLHGIVFAILAHTPCIALPSIDHKIPATLKWFHNLNNIKLCTQIDQLPDRLTEVLKASPQPLPNWNEEIFDPLYRKISKQGFPDEHRLPIG